MVFLNPRDVARVLIYKIQMRKFIPLFCHRSLSVPPPKTLLFRSLTLSLNLTFIAKLYITSLISKNCLTKNLCLQRHLKKVYSDE